MGGSNNAQGLTLVRGAEDGAAHSSPSPRALALHSLPEATGGKQRRTVVERAVAELADQLFEISAFVKSRGLVTGDDVRVLKRYRKVAGRPEMRSTSQLEDMLAEMQEMREALLRRIPPEDLCKALSRGKATAAGVEAPKRQRKPTLPLPLTALPKVELLEELEAGTLAWEEVLSAPKVKKEVTLSQVSGEDALLADVEFRRNVLALKGKMSAREAMKILLKREPERADVRRAQRVWARNEHCDAAVDRRHCRVTDTSVMVPLVMALTLEYYCGRTKASAKQVAALVNQKLATLEARARANGVTLPFPRTTESSVERFIARLPESVRVVRRKGFGEWAKQHRIVDKQNEAKYANHIWEIDHTPLDIAAILSAEQPDDIATVYATACVDAYSGVPLAVFVSSMPPDAFTTSLVLSMAIRRHAYGGVDVGGLPTILRPDHGKDFMSEHVAQVALALPIELDPAAQYNPDGKPHVERFFRTLNKALAIYPGHKGAEGRSEGAAKKRRDCLLTVRMVIEAVNKFCEQYSLQPQERGAGTPMQRYADTVQWREPKDLDELELLMLKYGEVRVMTREGVRFRNTFYKGMADTGDGHAYQDLIGRKVTIRYHPDIEQSIYVYDEETGTRIGEFFCEEVWQANFGARQANRPYMNDLKACTTDYQAHLRKADRAEAIVGKQKELEDMRQERIARDQAAGKESTPTRTEKSSKNKKEQEKKDKKALFAYLSD